MKSLIIAKLEFKKLYKSYMFLLGIVLLVLSPIFVEKSNIANHIEDGRYAAYTIMHALSMFGGFFIPFQIFYMFYHDQNTDIAKIIYSNPVLPTQYIIGKYLASLFTFLLLSVMGILICIIYPIFFSVLPFSPVQFLTAFFISLIPFAIFYTALCLFLQILFRHSIISILLCIFIFIFSDLLPEKFRFILRGRYLKAFTSNSMLSKTFISNLAANRLIYILLAILLVILSLIIYSPNRSIEQGGSV